MKCFDFLDGGMIFTSSLIQLRLPNRNAHSQLYSGNSMGMAEQMGINGSSCLREGDFTIKVPFPHTCQTDMRISQNLSTRQFPNSCTPCSRISHKQYFLRCAIV